MIPNLIPAIGFWGWGNFHWPIKSPMRFGLLWAVGQCLVRVHLLQLQLCMRRMECLRRKLFFVFYAMVVNLLGAALPNHGAAQDYGLSLYVGRMTNNDSTGALSPNANYIDSYLVAGGLVLGGLAILG